jgi:DNA-binding SARP family transcriptional activator/TolB-like protein/Flp pilus assembly protein TadD
LALLAVLAAARTGGVSRDKVAGLLWPETPEKQARHHLSDALWALHEALGEDAIVSLGDTLRLNPAVLGSDLGAFRSALESGDLETAVRLYAGPLLDGFYLSDTRDFEGWVESERQQLASQFANALESLADQAEEGGDYRQALGWWRKLAAHDPYDSRVAVRLMRALTTAGDPANALKYAQEHEVLLKREVGIEPPAEVRQLVERLRLGEDIAVGPQRAHAGEQEPHLIRRALLVVVPVAVLGVGAWIITSYRTRALERRSIAVLPCDARTGDTAQGLLADRWTEELIERLSRIGALRVKSWLSVRGYRGAAFTSDEVAAETGAHVLVRCRVEETEDDVRLSVQLIEVDSDEIVWSEDYRRNLSAEGVNEIQVSAARQIAAALGAGLAPGEAARLEQPLTDDLEALRLFRLGRYYTYLGQQQAQRAVEYFDRAIALDPMFGMAYVEKAAAIWMRDEGLRPLREFAPEHRQLVLKALEIDEGNARAHSELGLLQLTYNFDWRSAERHLKRAIELDPNSGEAHMWYGFALPAVGRADEGIVELARAVQLDPANPFAARKHAQGLVMAHRYDEALAEAQRALEMAPRNSGTLSLLGSIRLAQGEYDEGIARFAEAREILGPETEIRVMSRLAYGYARAGRRAEAEVILEQLEARVRDGGFVPAEGIALIHVGLDNTDEAFEWLERSYEQRGYSLLWLLASGPLFDSVRDDPRFQELRKRVGFEEW